MKNVVKISLAAAVILALAVGFSLAGPDRDAWLGVYTQTVDEDISKAFDIKTEYGAIVNEIVDDSPADKAGLKEDDIIIAFGGEKVMSDKDLLDLVRDRAPGDEVDIVVMRDNEKVVLASVLGDRKESRWSYFRDSSPRISKHKYAWTDDNREQAYIGVMLLDISDDLAAYFGADEGGVLINEVQEDSPAEKAGIRAGDVIVAVNDREVGDAGDVQKAVRRLEEGEVAKIALLRDKKQTKVDVPVEMRESSWQFYGSGPGIQYFDADDIRIPNMKGLPRSLSIQLDDLDDLRELYDSGEYEDAMDELRGELQELRDELKEIRKTKQ